MKSHASCRWRAAGSSSVTTPRRSLLLAACWWLPPRGYKPPTTSNSYSRCLTGAAVLPDALGDVETLLADSGYYSAANVTACAAAGIDPLVAMDRQPHHPSLDERFAPVPPARENPTPVEAMAHRLVTPDGKKLYALRRQTPEPVFGIIKSVLGFRQFLLRGLD